MKKILTCLICIIMVLSVSSVVFAESKGHFADGHDTIEFDDFGIALDLPSAWGYAQLDDQSFAMYPENNRDIFLTAYFFEYGSSDAEAALAKVFMSKTVEQSLEGILGDPQDGNSQPYELSNGREACLAINTNDDTIGICTSIYVWDYILVLSLISDFDHLDDAYGDDIDSILISAKEIK